MSKAQRYLGGRTPFGTIIRVNDRVYNTEATVEAKDGSTTRYRLPFLLAHGVTLPKEMPCPQQLPNPSSSPCAPDLKHPGNDDSTTTCS